jgi:hypothetical protein
MIQKNILFGMPIYTVHIDPKTYNKNYILNIIKKNYNLSPVRNNWDTHSNLHHAYIKDNENEKIKFDDVDYEKSGLLSVYNKVFSEFFNTTLKTINKFNYEYNIVNYTATKNNQFMEKHNHLPNDDFSVVHFLQFDKTHKSTIIYNHNDFATYVKYIRKDLFQLLDAKNDENSYMFEHWELNAKEDDLIIFPSVLNHKIINSNSDKLRVTIVSNLKIKKSE